MGEKQSAYRVYGLEVASDYELPELMAGPGRPDLTIHRASVAEPLASPVVDGPHVQAAPGRFRLRVPGVATFLATGGNDVAVATELGAKPEEVRVFLYGSVLGAILHQRGVLPLHASAVSDGAQAILFAGHSGHGKSTLAAAFLEHGYRLMADDVTAVRGAVAAPAYPHIKLFAANGSLDKQWRAVGDERFLGEPRPVTHVYVLLPDQRGEVALEEAASGSARLDLLIEHTYRSGFLAGLGVREVHFRACATLARQARVTAVRRPAAGCPVDELRQRIADHLAGLQLGWKTSSSGPGETPLAVDATASSIRVGFDHVRLPASPCFSGSMGEQCSQPVPCDTW